MLWLILVDKKLCHWERFASIFVDLDERHCSENSLSGKHRFIFLSSMAETSEAVAWLRLVRWCDGVIVVEIAVMKYLASFILFLCGVFYKSSRDTLKNLLIKRAL